MGRPLCTLDHQSAWDVVIVSCLFVDLCVVANISFNVAYVVNISYIGFVRIANKLQYLSLTH